MLLPLHRMHYYSSFCPPAGGIAPRPVFTPFVGVVMHSVYWIRYWSGRSVAPVTLHLSVCLSVALYEENGWNYQHHIR